MTQTHKYTVAVGCLLGIILLGYLSRPQTPTQDAVNLSMAPSSPPAPASQQATSTSGEVKGAKIATSTIFTHPSLGFSFQISTSSEVSRVTQEEDEEQIVFQTEGDVTLQVYISDFPATARLTQAWVRKNYPEMEIKKFRTIRIAGISGLYFETQIPDIESLVDVWFVRKQKLYQVSAYLANKGLLDELVASWKWNTSSK